MSLNNNLNFICLVHYHEVGLKGRNRSSFERQLKQNIEHKLAAFSNVFVKRISGRLLVEVNSWEDTAEVADRISRLPGVVRVSCGVKLKQDINAIQNASLWILEQCEPYESFKVDARRANTSFEIDSMTINQIVGAWLCEKLPNKKVKMKDPDARLHVEMVEGSAFVYAKTVKGVGGLPVGTAGSVVSLLSAGLDSPVATWRLIKRGAYVTALHFSGRPEAADTSEHLVNDIVIVLNLCGGVNRLCVVPFGEFQRRIAAIVPSELRVIFYRRLMIAVANRVAIRFNARALVTGESLGQVASQTLDNIFVVDSVAEYPILRPLIGTDKLEIIAEAERLGTYEISSQSHEDCCTLFMPRNPETHARPNAVEAIWQDLPIDVWLDEIDTLIEVTEFE